MTRATRPLRSNRRSAPASSGSLRDRQLTGIAVKVASGPGDVADGMVKGYGNLPLTSGRAVSSEK